MIKIEHAITYGWEEAIRGMRNPMNSWDKSDSIFMDDFGNGYNILGKKFPWPDEMYADTIIGQNDLALMKKLAQSGSDHAKYRRMISVYADITAPLYWWKEFDTYKVGTVANSCSTMHKIADHEFSRKDFSCEHLSGQQDGGATRICTKNELITLTPKDILELTIELLNNNRKLYLETKDKRYWWQMIQLLPSSYDQKRLVMMNYEVLSNIYKSRKDHKLDEWHWFCDWIEQLPYADEIIFKGGKPGEGTA